jgi:hypothetical protein
MIAGVIILSISGHNPSALLPGLTTYVKQLLVIRTNKMNVTDLEPILSQ